MFKHSLWMSFFTQQIEAEHMANIGQMKIWNAFSLTQNVWISNKNSTEMYSRRRWVGGLIQVESALVQT